MMVIFFTFDMVEVPTEVVRFLITAINGLTALQCLTISWRSKKLPDMTILNQLKVIVIDCISDNIRPFLRSLERHATNNVDLQVQLLSTDTKALFSLNKFFRNRIVRCHIEG